MSRGHGRVQAAILDFLREQPGANSFEEMRWALYDRLGEPSLSADGKLPTKWNTSFRRALHSLAESKPSFVTLEARHLTSLGECVRHYPGKTLLVDVFRLRMALLPVLQDWVEGRGPGPRYTAADNERFHFEGLSPEVVALLRKRWGAIEPQLIARLSALPLDQRNSLFLCIAKGKSLFENVTIKSGRSFVELARDCIAASMLTGKSATRLTALCEQFLAAPIAGFLKLKSYVHAFAHMPKHRRCTLKVETLEQLYRVQPAVLEGLPGFVPVPERRRRFHLDMTGPTHSKRVHSLLDQTVFQKFIFVRLGA